MSYIDDTLSSGEIVVYRGSLSLWSMAHWIIIALFLITFVVPPILILIYIAVVYFSTEMAVTNRRVLSKTGFISRNLIEVRLEKIESISIKQGIWGRICNFGTLYVTGTGSSRARIKGVRNPLAFRAMVELATDDMG